MPRSASAFGVIAFILRQKFVCRCDHHGAMGVESPPHRGSTESNHGDVQETMKGLHSSGGCATIVYKNSYIPLYPWLGGVSEIVNILHLRISTGNAPYKICLVIQQCVKGMFWVYYIRWLGWCSCIQSCNFVSFKLNLIVSEMFESSLRCLHEMYPEDAPCEASTTTNTT